MSMNVKTMFLFLLVGGAGHQALVAAAATAAASAATDTDELIDTRLNFVVRSAELGSTIDTRTPSGTLIMVH